MQKVIVDDIALSTEKDIILTHLYVKCRQKGIVITEPVREMLYYLYAMGGIESKKDFDDFVKTCSDNTRITNEDSVRNTLSRCVTMKIVKNLGKYQKQISEDWLPKPKEDETYIGLHYRIVNESALSNAV